jgi:hypothetical protein
MTSPTPPPEKNKSGLGAWVSSHQKAVVGILIVVGVIFFILISKGKSSASSSTNTTTPNSNGGSQYTYNGGGEFGGGYANSAEYGQLENQLSNISTGLSTLAKPPTPPPTTTPPPTDNHHHHQIPSGNGWAGNSDWKHGNNH